MKQIAHRNYRISKATKKYFMRETKNCRESSCRPVFFFLLSMVRTNDTKKSLYGNSKQRKKIIIYCAFQN